MEPKASINLRAQYPRPIWISLLLLILTVAAGLLIRFALPGLPPFIVKYGGSALWALMVYWIVSTLSPSWSVQKSWLVAGILATCVEFFKLVHTPALDAFRVTLPGILLFGRFFSLWDIVAYWWAMFIGMWLDIRIRALDMQSR